MKNINELREELALVFQGLKDGSVSPQIASEQNNSAGKIINTVKLELEFGAQRKEKPKIPFLIY